MDDERRGLHALLSEVAFDAWHEQCAEEGTSVSGLLEAFGLIFARAVDPDLGLHGTPMGLTPEVMDRVVKVARRVDARRRRRGGG